MTKAHRSTLASRRYGTIQAQRGYGETVRRQVQHAMLERISWRGLGHLLGISRRTVAAWVEAWARALPPVEETLTDAHLDNDLELDEVWLFVLKKDQQRWIGVAMCCRTRQIVAYFMGDRTEASCLQLWRRIPNAYTHCH